MRALVEMAAPDVGAQLVDHAGKIVERHRHGDAERRAGDAAFLVGADDVDGKADDLPRRRQPLHDQRQRDRQHRRLLQGGNVERGCHRRDLRIGESARDTRQPGAERVERFVRVSMMPIGGRSSTASARPTRASARGRRRRHRRCDTAIASAAAIWNLRTAFRSDAAAGSAQCASAASNSSMASSAPSRQPSQIGTSDERRIWPGPAACLRSGTAPAGEHQPRRIVDARPRLVVGAAHDLAQFARARKSRPPRLRRARCALELAHQQRLRLRRKLRR